MRKLLNHVSFCALKKTRNFFCVYVCMSLCFLRGFVPRMLLAVFWVYRWGGTCTYEHGVRNQKRLGESRRAVEGEKGKIP